MVNISEHQVAVEDFDEDCQLVLWLRLVCGASVVAL